MPKELGKLALLESLYLHENQLVSTPTLPFLTALTNCSHLQKIDLSNNPLGGILPVSIAQLSNNLTLLDLSNTSIHGSIPHEIGNLTSLTYLALANNLLSGRIPPELGMFLTCLGTDSLEAYHDKLQVFQISSFISNLLRLVKWLWFKLLIFLSTC